MTMKSTQGAQAPAARPRVRTRSIVAATALGLLAMFCAPTLAAAETQARICMHVPQGENFNSESAPVVFLLKDKSFWENDPNLKGSAWADPKSTPVALGLNFDYIKTKGFLKSLDAYAKETKKQFKMQFKYNCNVVQLGVSGEKFTPRFRLEDHDKIIIKAFAFSGIDNDDFCADQAYIQIIENGQLMGTRRYLSGDQKCWGDSFSGASYQHIMIGQKITNVPGNTGDQKITYGKGTGRWEYGFCPDGGQNCKQTISESVTKGGEKSFSKSRETTNAISVALSVGVEVEGFGAKFSSELTTETSTSETVQTAKSTARNWSKNKTITQEYTFDYGLNNIYRVWRWVVELPASSGPPVRIETNVFTCTPPGETYPAYLPNEKKDDRTGFGWAGSCNPKS